MSRGFSVSSVCVGALILAACLAACAEGNTLDDVLAGGKVDAGRVDGGSPALPSDGGGPGPEEDGGGGDGGGKTDGGSTVSPACAAALATASYNFEGDDQGWTHTDSDGAKGANPTWPFDVWTRGAATTIACPTGQCFAAERTQNYPQCSRGELISPKIDLTACKSPSQSITLVFTHAYKFWTGDLPSGTTWFDGGTVDISGDDGVSWQIPQGTFPGTVKILPTRGSLNCVLPNSFHVHNKNGFVGSQETPIKVELQVPAASVTDKMRIRFSQASGIAGNSSDPDNRTFTPPGWRVDDIHFIVK